MDKKEGKAIQTIQVSLIFRSRSEEWRERERDWSDRRGQNWYTRESQSDRLTQKIHTHECFPTGFYAMKWRKKQNRREGMREEEKRQRQSEEQKYKQAMKWDDTMRDEETGDDDEEDRPRRGKDQDEEKAMDSSSSSCFLHHPHFSLSLPTRLLFRKPIKTPFTFASKSLYVLLLLQQ